MKDTEDFIELPKKIGRLTVIGFLRPSKYANDYYFRLLCDCGQTVALTTSEILNPAFPEMMCNQCFAKISRGKGGKSGNGISSVKIEKLYQPQQLLIFKGEHDYIRDNETVIFISIDTQNPYYCLVEYQGKSYSINFEQLSVKKKKAVLFM